MAMVDIYPVYDLRTFSATVASLSQAADGRPLWFRGSHDASHELLPSLLRHPTTTDVEQLLELEARLLSRFRQRSVPFIASRLPSADWEFLFLMQHYGVPTRLLDWSENSFVALWFALSPPRSAEDYRTRAVWVIDPIFWNRQVFSHQKYDGGIFSVDDVQLTGYEAKADMGSMNAAPVAVYGTHNSPRIVAQRGVFTIAGKDNRPLEAFADDFKDKTPCVWRIEITAEFVAPLTGQFRGAGFTESMIFPDLEGLAREIKYSEGF
jgi:hypothetical protein